MCIKGQVCRLVVAIFTARFPVSILTKVSTWSDCQVQLTSVVMPKGP